MQFFAWNCSNFGDIKTAMMTNLLVILYVLNWLQTSGIRLSEVSADRLELWVKQTSNFQVDRDGLGADEAAWAEGDAKRNQRNVGGGRLYLQTCKCLESSKNFWCPRVLEKKSFIYQETTTLMGFLGLLSPIRIFVGPLGITCFCQTNLGKSPLEGWFICHQACATPCHGEAQWLVVPCWMYFVFMGILGANWHWHPWNKALKRVFLLVATQVFFISPRNLGEMDPFWRAYFSKGLVQPPTRVEHGNFLYFLAGCALEGITLKFPWLFDFFCFSLSWRFFFRVGGYPIISGKTKTIFLMECADIDRMIIWWVLFFFKKHLHHWSMSCSPGYRAIHSNPSNSVGKNGKWLTKPGVSLTIKNELPKFLSYARFFKVPSGILQGSMEPFKILKGLKEDNHFPGIKKWRQPVFHLVVLQPPQMPPSIEKGGALMDLHDWSTLVFTKQRYVNGGKTA